MPGNRESRSSKAPMECGFYVATWLERQILQIAGKSCLEVKVGTHADSTPRLDIVHWNNCVPAFGTPVPSVKAKRGRKPLNPNASPFVSYIDYSVVP